MDRSSAPALHSGLAILAIGGLLTWRLTRRSKQILPYPPGPKPLPVIGNFLDIPREKEWLVYQQWAHKYGDIMHVEVLGKHIIILNSAEITSELFERRSSTYSDRPEAIMLSDLMDFAGWEFGLFRYGSLWRKYRRMFHSQMHPNAVLKYRSVQMRQARLFLQQLLADSSDISASVRGVVGATIMDVVYGIQVTGPNDPYITIAEEVVHLFGLALLPGKFLVDMLPLLRYVPGWFPGAGFQKTAELVRRLSDKMLEDPMRVVEARMDAGDKAASMTSYLIEEAHDKRWSDERKSIRNVAGVSYAAGADTTVSTLCTFFLAMAIHPEVQDKAQAELDAVVGQERLPEYADRASLPYVDAIISELLRWQPVLPLGAAHTTTADDEYNGYLIPKGSIVIGNVWSILRNPQEYTDPDEFRPERFLKVTADGKYIPNKDVRDPRVAFFGFGRRICPGRHLANQSLFAIVASVLSVFSITPPLGEMGNPVPLTGEMSNEMIRHPLPFKCTIKPRTHRSSELIDQPLPERGL